MNQELEAAIMAVSRACRVARRVQQAYSHRLTIQKVDMSPVTVADFAVQALICRLLSAAFDELVLVGEESSKMLRQPENAYLLDAVLGVLKDEWPEVTSEQLLDAIDLGGHDGTSKRFWTLDPVDGTKGFIRGGQYAISLALLDAGNVTLGVMGCPNLSAEFNRRFDDPDATGQIFFASEQAGAWSLPADQPQAAPTALRVGSGTQDHRPVRVVESVEAAHSNQKATAEILATLASVSVQRLDSQCKYGVVARNQADVYFRYPSRPGYREKIWDHAAGAIIATEAGGIVSDIDGKPLDFSRGSELTENRGIICATPAVHPAVVAAAQQYQARGEV